MEKRIVSTILHELDRVSDAAGGGVVMAATNRASALDPALRRPGRFDREVEIGMEQLSIHRAMGLHCQPPAVCRSAFHIYCAVMVFCPFLWKEMMACACSLPSCRTRCPKCSGERRDIADSFETVET